MNNINKLTFVYIFFVTAIFVSLILFAASDLRGSDQYWYVADVDTLLHGGSSTTNNVYPVHLMSKDVMTSPHFIHNILSLYLVLPAAMLFGSFKGWIVTNLIATILTASLIALIIKKIANEWISSLAYTVYLLLPLTVWQSSQPLAEATITPFIALAMLIYMRPDKNEYIWGLLLVVAGLLYYCRSSFSPLLVIIPIAYLVQNRNTKIRSIAFSIGFLCLTCLIVMAKQIIFPGETISFRDIIQASSIPGSSSMSSFFSISPAPIVLSDICSKVIRNLLIQVSADKWTSQVFYLPFNILAAFSIYLFLTKKSETESRIAHCGIILLLIHIATIMIHQNQPRYMLLPIPAILACSVLLINRINFFQLRQAQIVTLLAVTFCLTVLSMPLVIRSHNEGLRERELRVGLARMFDSTVAKNESLMVDTTRNYNLILGYVLRPRTVIYITSGYSKEDYQTLRRKGNAQWLFCPMNSPLLEYLEYFDIHTQPVLRNFPSPYDDYGLFSLRESEAVSHSKRRTWLDTCFSLNRCNVVLPVKQQKS